MKNLILFIALTSIPTLYSFKILAPTDHIGEWTAEFEGEEGTFIFDAEGYFTMIIDGDTVGGKSMITEDGEEGQGVYHIDYSTNPKSLDMSFNNLTLGETYTIQAIFKFIDKTQMIICIGDDEEIRPKTFDEGESVTFNKVR